MPNAAATVLPWKGRGPLGLRLLRNGHPIGDTGVRARGDRAPHPPDPGAGRDRAPGRQVCTHRSMIEFMRGIRTPLSTTLIPASAKTASNNSGNLPSRSRIKNRAQRSGPAAHEGIQPGPGVLVPFGLVAVRQRNTRMSIAGISSHGLPVSEPEMVSKPSSHAASGSDWAAASRGRRSWRGRPSLASRLAVSSALPPPAALAGTSGPGPGLSFRCRAGVATARPPGRARRAASATAGSGR